MSKLFLYDFDGTITNKDSLFAFLKHTTTRERYYRKCLFFVPLFFLARAGIVAKASTKEKFIGAFLKGKKREEIEAFSKSFLKTNITSNFYKSRALDSIKHHKKEGTVYLVSASLDLWLKDIATFLGVGLICTEAKFYEDTFTGKFKTPNCNYDQKPIRVRDEINLNKYTEIIYFGDSNGDLAMRPLTTSFYLNHF